MKFTFLIVLLLLIAPFQVNAQEHPPQLLYQKDNLLYLANATTGESIPLQGIDAERAIQWLWSPNGQFILKVDYIQSSLTVYDVDNPAAISIVLQIDAPPNEIYLAAWSPDSTKISYSQNIHELVGEYNPLPIQQGQLRVYDLTSGKDTLLFETSRTELNRDRWIGSQWWSPTGDSILFSPYIWHPSSSTMSLVLIDPNGGEPIQLPGHASNGYDLAWSPDGEWILVQPNLCDIYNSCYDGDILLFSAEDGTYYQVSNPTEIWGGSLRWSPDGHEIQFEREGKIITIELQDVIDNDGQITEKSEPIPYVPRFGLQQTLSPDGMLMSYLYREGNHYNLWVVDTASFTSYLKIDEIPVGTINDFVLWRP